MNNNDLNVLSNEIPEIYCAISVIFNTNIDVESVLNELRYIGINNVKVCRPKYESVTYIDFAIIHYEKFWHLSDAITKMFLQIDNCIVQLKNIITKYGGETLIDIAFYQYGTHPSLVLSGENMKKIHYLDAHVSIDAN